MSEGQTDSTDLLISVLGDEVEGGLWGEEAGDQGQHWDHWQGVLHIHLLCHCSFHNFILGKPQKKFLH